ncbi:MAG: hypothetical protein MUO54_16270 [Anaerolineales bacterium]|nr:hypothetical protein [Anaerolineales bacterium]
MNRRITPLFSLILILGLSLFISGCLTLSDDITPPPANVQTGSISNTPVPRTLAPTLDHAQATDTSGEETTTDDTTPGVVYVEVLDFTGGALLDQGLEVRLEAYENFMQVYEETLTIPSTGIVDFNEAPFLAGQVYFASIAYGGAVYRSEVTELAPDASELVLQVQIFETTTDDSGLTIDRIHVFIDFPEPDLVQIVEIYIVSNFGNATVVADTAGLPTVSFPLPEGAASIEFENGVLGERYLKTEDGFGDTVSIPPGSGVYQVLVYYTLPYQRNKLDYSHPVSFPVEAVVVMTPANQVKVKGNSLEDLGVQSIPDGAMQVYAGESLAKGEKLKFQISGNPETALPQVESSPLQVPGYLIVLAVLGVGMILSGIWLYFRNRKLNEVSLETDQLESEEDREKILDQIIALEDLYSSGDITEKEFQKKRKELKKKLADLVQK